MKRAPWRLSLNEPTGKKIETSPGSGKEVKAEAIVVATDGDAPGSASSKGRGKAPELTRMVRDLSLMTLQNSAAIRQLNAAVYDMGILPGKLGCIQKSVKAGQSYATAVKEAGKGHNLGSPHLHKGAAFLDGLLEEDEIKAHATLLSDLEHLVCALNGCETQTEAESFMSHFKLAEVYNADKDAPKLYKVEYAFHPLHELVLEMGDSVSAAAAHASVTKALKALNADFKSGSAPMSNLERQLSTNLNKLQKSIK